MAKYLAQIVVLGAQVVGRAFTRALRQEFAAAGQTASRQKGSRNGGLSESIMNAKHGMSLQEAKQILNVENEKLSDIDLINQKYKHLFDVNDKSKGGSFYIQSKVVRAKERIDDELKIFSKNSTHSETNVKHENSSHDR